MANLILTRPNRGGGGGVSVFGSEYHDAESLGMTTTNGVDFVQKVTLTTASVPLGDYRINWSFQWNHNAINSDFEAFVAIVGSPLDYLAVYKQEPKDAGSAPSFVDIPANTIPYPGLDGVGPGQNYITSGTAQRYEYAGFAVKKSISGVLTIAINFRSDELGDESSMWNARLDFWRVR